MKLHKGICSSCTKNSDQLYKFIFLHPERNEKMVCTTCKKILGIKICENNPHQKIEEDLVIMDYK